MKKIGILTSGGDGPGMNAAIHAIVSAAAHHNLQCIGFEHGYNGLLHRDFRLLTPTDVQHISHRGGTILKSARCKEMREPRYQQQAAENLSALALDGLIVIGGDGSFRGADAIQALTGKAIIGVPGTIDNDIDGSDFSIGYFTAVHTAVEAIDKIRDTADAFDRIFVVEVMGRHSGFLALDVAVATEAEQVICPEMNLVPENLLDNVIEHINGHFSQFGYTSYIIVLAENSLGDSNSEQLAATLQQHTGIDCRAVVLGHIQRGGTAMPRDRILATKLGVFAVDSLLAGKRGVMVGEIGNNLVLTALSATGQRTKKPSEFMLDLYRRGLFV